MCEPPAFVQVRSSASNWSSASEDHIRAKGQQLVEREDHDRPAIGARAVAIAHERCDDIDGVRGSRPCESGDSDADGTEPNEADPHCRYSRVPKKSTIW